MTNRTIRTVVPSFAPSAFKDDPAGQLSEDIANMPLEDIIIQYQEQEKKRGRVKDNTPEEEEAILSFRTAPEGLTHTLRAAALDFQVSGSILTRCLSHQIASWYATQDGITDVLELFHLAYAKISDFGYPDIGNKLVRAEYQFQKPAPHKSTLKTINWVVLKLDALAPALGTRPVILFQIGLLRTLCNSRNGKFKGMSSKFFLPELEAFRNHVAERLDEVQSMKDRIEKRRSLEVI